MWFPSLLLVLGSMFFVAAEYSIVSSRKSRLDNLAKQGNKTAKGVLRLSITYRNTSPRAR